MNHVLPCATRVSNSVATSLAGHAQRVGIPRLGLGTWLSPAGKAGAAVKEALATGYRHIDCAAIYQNEREIGDLAFAHLSGAQRQRIWITSKLWLTEQRPEDVRAACEKTLHDLKLDYLDLYLIHWPVPLAKDVPGGGSTAAAAKLGITALRPKDFLEIPLTDTWEAMGTLKKAGLVKNVGVSNCSAEKMRKLIAFGGEPVANLQVELHPYLQQPKLLQFCADNGISVTAYSPLGSPQRPWVTNDPAPLLEDELLVEMSRKYKTTAATIAISWALHRGTVAIPKSVSPARIEANLDAAELVLSESDMARLEGLDRHQRMILGKFFCRPGESLGSFWGDETQEPEAAS